MHLQVFKVKSRQVWASPRKQIKQNYHGASTRVEFPQATTDQFPASSAMGKKQTAVSFINHCINDSMLLGVVGSKELCKKYSLSMEKPNV